MDTLSLEAPGAAPATAADNAPWIDDPLHDIDLYVGRLRRRPAYDLAGRLAEWRRDGFTVFEAAVGEDIIDAAVADLDAFIAAPGAFNIPVEVNGRSFDSAGVDDIRFDLPGVKIYQFHCFSRAAARALLAPAPTDFISHLFGSAAAVLQSQAFVRGGVHLLQSDSAYVASQTQPAFLVAGWVCLEDTLASTGPLALFPGGHAASRMDAFASIEFDWGGGRRTYGPGATRTPQDFSDHLTRRMQQSGIAAQPQLLRKGDVVLWHADLPNMELPIEDVRPSRRAILAHYTSIRTFPRDFRAPFSEIRGLGVFENGGYAHRLPRLLDRPVLPSWT
jgi:ectoine hydroxylase-related dioxygenase (phytanoyl-CoA dioxygenase family)